MVLALLGEAGTRVQLPIMMPVTTMARAPETPIMLAKAKPAVGMQRVSSSSGSRRRWR